MIGLAHHALPSIRPLRQDEEGSLHTPFHGLQEFRPPGERQPSSLASRSKLHCMVCRNFYRYGNELIIPKTSSFLIHRPKILKRQSNVFVSMTQPNVSYYIGIYARFPGCKGRIGSYCLEVHSNKASWIVHALCIDTGEF